MLWCRPIDQTPTSSKQQQQYRHQQQLDGTHDRPTLLEPPLLFYQPSVLKSKISDAIRFFADPIDGSRMANQLIKIIIAGGQVVYTSFMLKYSVLDPDPDSMERIRIRVAKKSAKTWEISTKINPDH